MTSKLMFVPDTHVVVPKQPDGHMTDAAFFTRNEGFEYQYQAIIEASPQLTTPPVLRWEGADEMMSCLYVGNKLIATVQRCIDGRWENFMIEFESYKSENEARRAAEKALGLDECPEV